MYNDIKNVSEFLLHILYIICRSVQGQKTCKFWNYKFGFGVWDTFLSLSIKRKEKKKKKIKPSSINMYFDINSYSVWHKHWYHWYQGLENERWEDNCKMPAFR